jgi:hypothetical protein
VERNDGSQLGVGIQPTHPVERTIERVAEGIDEALQYAIEPAQQG